MSKQDPTGNLPGSDDGTVGDFTLDAFVDGQLSAEERAAFERQAMSSASVAAELTAQARLDDLIGHAYAPPGVGPFMNALQLTIGKGTPPTSPAPPTGGGKLGSAGKLLMSAAILLTAGALLYSILPDGNYRPRQKASAVFMDAKAADFAPPVGVTSEATVSQALAKRVQRPVAIAGIPSDARLVGVADCDSLNPNTMAVFANVCGTRVVAFVDAKSHAARPTVPWGSGLHVYQRQLDTMIIYELSPLDHPSLLKSFFIPPPPSHCHEAP